MKKNYSSGIRIVPQGKTMEINTFESEIFTLKSIYIKTDTDTGIDDLERALK